MAPTSDHLRHLTRHARTTEAARVAQDDLWSRGSTRRRFLGGVGLLGVAALGSQLVTTRAAFAADPTATGNTLVLVTLRGGQDGLRILLPATKAMGSEFLAAVRPHLIPDRTALRVLSGAPGWAANAALDPVLPLWNTGELAFVPAAGTGGTSRSHVDAQHTLDCGGQPGPSSGWIDRLLTQLGPGTTLRSVGFGTQALENMVGPESKIVVPTLADFTLPSPVGYEDRIASALSTLYRQTGGPLGQAVTDTLRGLHDLVSVPASTGPQNGAVYAAGDTVGQTFADLATLLRAEVGLQVATLDVGGWDTHTAEAPDLDAGVRSLATSLAAFMTDLGPDRRSRVTVVVASEFGRRVAENEDAGTDHGLGGLVWLLGGGLARSQVAGPWPTLGPAALDHGDLKVQVSTFDVLGEIARARLGVGSLTPVFPGAPGKTWGIARAA